jgi:hypothetical protein
MLSLGTEVPATMLGSGELDALGLSTAFGVEPCWVPGNTRTPTITATSNAPTDPKNTILDLELFRASESGQSFLSRSFCIRLLNMFPHYEYCSPTRRFIKD